VSHRSGGAGFLTSAFVGYQWTFVSRWLAGIETEIGYATNSATTGVPGVSNAPGDSVGVKEDWEGGVRARLGYAVAPNTVVYATTGLALQHLQATVTCTSATPFPCGRFGPVTAISATNSPTLSGWTLGGGAEYALTGNLRLRAEYRYSDYGTYNATYGNPANVAVSSAIRLRTNTAVLGLTYAFGVPSAPAPTPSPPITK
jgi:outer membrane immunogenic protein